MTVSGSHRSVIRRTVAAVTLVGGAVLALAARAPLSPRARAELWDQVEIIRTEAGVPHVRAENMRAAGYALAWLQSEDYGPKTAVGILRGRGTLGAVFGRDSIGPDFTARFAFEQATRSFSKLQPETREIYEGFAAGLNRYIALHPVEFPDQMPADFTAIDVLAGDITEPAWGLGRTFAPRHNAAGPRTRGTRRTRDASDASAAEDPTDDVGSNAWAFAPSRTKSGRAILLRNPHLAWTAGYYEAHLTVPGVVDFYGDFRIGGPFAVIGGFNSWLGWSTTNNAQTLSEIYELQVDPKRADHYLWDGESVALERREVTVRYRTASGTATESKEFFFSKAGAMIHRTPSRIYVVKTAGDGEFRVGDQFVGMMRARTLEQWKSAMRVRARATSNFTYADRAGNILLLWNATLPALPHPSGGDSIATPASGTKDVWTRYVPFDSLPLVLNPRGGYVHNENSSPHFTNFSVPPDTTNAYPNFERPSFSLRSQLALQLVSDSQKVDLDEVIRRKHSYRMLLADRVKPDLLRAVVASRPTGELASALALLDAWPNDAAPESKGAVLFELWWQRYGQGLADSARYAAPWRAAEPASTPRGLAHPERAVESLRWAIGETIKRYGAMDVAWGTVHRVHRGSVDVPVGGCAGALGCFRVLTFEREADGRLAANGGDGWVLAVEFTDTPRAWSILAYGESNRPDSPWYSAQAERFARGQFKRVAFTAADVEAGAVLRYRPGAP